MDLKMWHTQQDMYICIFHSTVKLLTLKWTKFTYNGNRKNIYHHSNQNYSQEMITFMENGHKV